MKAWRSAPAKVCATIRNRYARCQCSLRWTKVIRSPSDGDRMTLVHLKEHWHRAYLLRMVAQTLAGAERQAFIAYAESARKECVALAGARGAPRASLGGL